MAANHTANRPPASVYVTLLDARRAAALDLESASKQAHWNLKGPHCIALHQLLDELHSNIEEHVDTIAGRITAHLQAGAS